MAIYGLRMGYISRSKRHSAVAAAAYQSAECLVSLDGIRDFRKKSGVLATEIIVPKGAPDWATDRQSLWMEAELAGKRKDSQLAKSIMVSLPSELSLQDNIDLTKKLCKVFVNHGMVADMAVHQSTKNKRNIHAHILLTTRDIEEKGFGKVNRTWSDYSDEIPNELKLTTVRETWADMVNQSLSSRNKTIRIDHRSYHTRKLSLLPRPCVRWDTYRNAQRDKNFGRPNIVNDIFDAIAKANQRTQTATAMLEAGQEKKEAENEINGAIEKIEALNKLFGLTPQEEKEVMEEAKNKEKSLFEDAGWKVTPVGGYAPKLTKEEKKEKEQKNRQIIATDIVKQLYDKWEKPEKVMKKIVDKANEGAKKNKYGPEYALEFEPDTYGDTNGRGFDYFRAKENEHKNAIGAWLEDELKIENEKRKYTNAEQVTEKPVAKPTTTFHGLSRKSG